MEALKLNSELLQRVQKVQQLEINSYHAYRKVLTNLKNSYNKNLLQTIASKELEHYNLWKSYTRKDYNPNYIRVWFYFFLVRIFGITFGLKLMTRLEKREQQIYRELATVLPQAKDVLKDEIEQEKEMLEMIKDDNLQYMGSVVLGINDALVELTGALAGLTLALQNTRLIAITGLITGLAASLSMAASEYLSTKTEGDREPFKSSVFTGIAYVFTVIILIIPYFLFAKYYHALVFTLINGVVVVALFTFYISVVKGFSFYKRFLEMLAISFTVAIISFGIGYLVRMFIPVEI